MRTWGRVWDAYGVPKWVEVATDERGSSDYVYCTALVQCLQLNLGESPFWGDFGIPAHQAVIQQIAPDYNVQFIASYFAQFFASLIISRAPIAPPAGTARQQQQNRSPLRTNPQEGVTYYAQALLHDGTVFQATVAT
ncbi:MAG: hypothetical protein N2444_00020 [Methylocystis sp.]|nr:hypothetical protein [Methylocystis sp.]